MTATIQTTPVIDCQVHAYERDHPGRPWVGHLHGPAQVTGADMVAAMDAVGVDGALLVSPWSMYRYDASYAREVHAQFPQRFGLIKPFDPQAPGVAEAVAEWARLPGVVGARVVYLGDAPPAAEDPGLAEICKAGAACGIPVNILCWDDVSLAGGLAGRHPNTRIVVDHLGIRQPFEPPVPAEPFAGLDEVVALARYDNIAIKLSGVCTLSHQAYPFADLRGPLQRILGAFGVERCLWGTDWTRATAFVTYRQAVDVFRDADWLSPAERTALMGGSLAAIYDWSPGADP